MNPAEQAAILRFGKYIKTVGAGPHWIPPFIEQKIVRNVDSVSDYSYSAQMLTKDENLVSVALVVQYRVGDLAAYLFNVTDPKESLHQATSSALRQVVGTTTLDQMITEGREAWGSNVRESLNKILDKYKTGIVIVNVSPQPARAPDSKPIIKSSARAILPSKARDAPTAFNKAALLKRSSCINCK